jgi:hypothetical protein
MGSVYLPLSTRLIKIRIIRKELNSMIRINPIGINQSLCFNCPGKSAINEAKRNIKLIPIHASSIYNPT